MKHNEKICCIINEVCFCRMTLAERLNEESEKVVHGSIGNREMTFKLQKVNLYFLLLMIG